MKKIFFVSAAMMLILSSCHSFKKSSEGLEYKIVSGGSDKKISQGDFFELWYDIEYKDSKMDTVLATSLKGGTKIIEMDSLKIPPSYYKIFSQLGNNDSVVVRLSTDSIMKNGQAPPFMKKGEYIVWHYKVANVYTDKIQADSAMNAQKQIAMVADSVLKAKQMVIDSKFISDNLAKNNISFVKGTKGTFVAIQTPGTGAKIDTSNEVEVNYTGKSFEGKPFDSNIDPSFGHTTPLPIKMWLTPETGGVIAGWTDGLLLLSKGAKATFYIPSSLAYGARGAGDRIQPNENLVFDIEIVDVLTRAQSEAKDAEEKIKMNLLHQKYVDSVEHAQKNLPNK
jgi:FKBP-type peptidyl-prolyl cis-trans isomerase FkpA